MEVVELAVIERAGERVHLIELAFAGAALAELLQRGADLPLLLPPDVHPRDVLPTRSWVSVPLDALRATSTGLLEYIGAPKSDKRSGIASFTHAASGMKLTAR